MGESCRQREDMQNTSDEENVWGVHAEDLPRRWRGVCAYVWLDSLPRQ